MSVTISIQKARGYSGIKSNPSYVAAITGSDDKYGFDRHFLEPDKIDWPDGYAWHRTPKAIRTDHYQVEEGLYEVAQYGERSYCMAWIKKGVGLVKLYIDHDRALKMAALLGAGETLEAARRATKEEVVGK